MCVSLWERFLRSHVQVCAILLANLSSAMMIVYVNNLTVSFESDPQISNVCVTWELVGVADFWPPPTYQSGTL